MTEKLNRVGENFDRAQYMEARRITVEAVEEVASKVEVGMSEMDGHTLIETVLKDQGYEKYWHPHKFRIGRNTLCAFRDKSDESIRLQENDIFFVDIGPIFHNHEGDYGRTFVFGENQTYHNISKASEELFNECEKVWASDKLTGSELYDFARKRAQVMGYDLEDRQNGHRLGDFPHALHFRGRLGEVTEQVAPDLWILEIHLLDKERRFGAFFEDLLLKTR